MRQRGRTRDDDAGPLPLTLLLHERQLRRHPFVPEPGRRLRIAVDSLHDVTGDAATLSFGEVRLHPHDRIQERHQRALSGAHPLDEDHLESDGHLDGAGAPALIPGRRSVTGRLPAPDGLKHAANQQLGPAEEGVVPRDVVGVHHR